MGESERYASKAFGGSIHKVVLGGLDWENNYPTHVKTSVKGNEKILVVGLWVAFEYKKQFPFVGVWCRLSDVVTFYDG